ncbi:MAG: DivIVA domain-containing protein [Bacteroidetes bacterium]|nr:DivIVA domain-containing protein [Bacteroidota bacterium]
MKLSALDIKKQDFKKTMRGYDLTEVRAFLDIVSSQWESLVSENRDQSTRLTELETQLKDYRQVEKVLHQTMLNAEETSRQTIENARQQSQNMVKEAELKGSSIIEAARRDVAELRQQIQILNSQRSDIINRLKGMVDLLDKNVKEFENQHARPHSLDQEEAFLPKPEFDPQPVTQTQLSKNQPAIQPKPESNTSRFEPVSTSEDKAEPVRITSFSAQNQPERQSSFVAVNQEPQTAPEPDVQDFPSAEIKPTVVLPKKEKINLDHILNQLD